MGSTIGDEMDEEETTRGADEFLRNLTRTIGIMDDDLEANLTSLEFEDSIGEHGSCLRFQFFCSLLMSVLCVIGVLGNLLSFCIFTRSCMRSSINILLAGLCLVDTWVLIIAVPVFVLPGLNHCDLFGSLETLHMIVVFGLYQLGMMAQTCSVYTFVLISIERYLAVVHPLHVQQFLTVRRAKCAQFALLSFAAIYNLARFWEYELVYDDYEDDEEVPGIRYARLLRANEAYFLGYYTVSFMVVHFLTPFSIITFLNAKIVKSIIRAGKVRSAMTQGSLGIDGGSHDQRKQRQISRMIVLVTAFFVFCNFLPFLLNLWEAIKPSLFESEKWSNVAYLTLDISNLLVIMNSSLNILIYLVYCRQYRRLFLYYIRCQFCRRRNSQNRDFDDLSNTYELGRLRSASGQLRRCATSPLLLTPANGSPRNPSASIAYLDCDQQSSRRPSARSMTTLENPTSLAGRPSQSNRGGYRAIGDSNRRSDPSRRRLTVFE